MTTKAKILDIAMNLNRIGNWAADGYLSRKDRICIFLTNTSNYLKEIEDVEFPPSVAGTMRVFMKEYKVLESEGLSSPKNPDIWAEKMMTWGNILTHRARLFK